MTALPDHLAAGALALPFQSEIANAARSEPDASGSISTNRVSVELAHLPLILGGTTVAQCVMAFLPWTPRVRQSQFSSLAICFDCVVLCFLCPSPSHEAGMFVQYFIIHFARDCVLIRF
jgi:hypothetical protein